jgi:hypothetical protein
MMRGSLPNSSHSRIYLDVPFSQKGIAKRHGAKWDPVRRQWFVENEWNCEALIEFVPQPVRAMIEPKILERQQREEADSAWWDHPPRSEDATVIWRMAGLTKLRPVRMTGFCGMCDSLCKDKWFVSTDIPLCELGHLAHTNGALYPKELSIVIQALEDGRIKSTGSRSRIFRWFRKKH